MNAQDRTLSWKLLRSPITIVIVAFLLRLLFLFGAHTYRFTRPDDSSFQSESTMIAVSIAQGHGFGSPFGGATGPSAWLAPLYPYLCALLVRIFGVLTPQLAAAILCVNALFSAVTAVPILQLGRRLSGETLALIAAWLWALTPYFMKWPLTWAWDISLATLCAAYLVEQTLRLKDANPEAPRDWAGLGILFGFSLLVNPALLTLLPLSLFWLRRSAAKWKHLAILAMACFVVISPWLARNRIVFGKWVFLRSNFVFELDMGNFHLSPGSCWWGRHPAGNPNEYALYQQMGEVAYIQKHGQRFREFLRQHPEEFVALTGKRFVMFWDGTSFRQPWAKMWLPWLYVPLTLGAGLGILFLWRDKIPDATFLFLIVILYPWAYYITCIQTRFRAPIEPLLLLASVYFLMATWRIVSARLRRSPGASPA